MTTTYRPLRSTRALPNTGVRRIEAAYRVYVDDRSVGIVYAVETSTSKPNWTALFGYPIGTAATRREATEMLLAARGM